ncbi:hypothetical protein I8752_16935 [Nostocaceae cyanobacterium CENA369]|uniref:Uncharacterized protein n=1 Tax=Dendronalium phyllosphericum CENA369 TaxID=1725256 RepID=A0A8J7I2B0_9NOST|nr:hypothetical protein [Dendronalium phyllosphericum]MBH8574679.1 hypothetical protein [Dendronalium phyllosphericum CENA369]
MNRVISWLRNIRVYQVVVVFLVGFIFLLGQAFSYAHVAQADVKTPEGIYYKGAPDGVTLDNQGEVRNDNQLENTQNKLKSAADNIREKLNLDEKTPRATKEFLDSGKNKSANKLYETKEGYYQTPSSR